MSLPIEPATEDDVYRFFGAIEFTADWHGRVMRKGNLVAAFGGALKSDKPGEWFGFLEVPKHLRRPSLLRHALSVLKEAKASGAKVIKTGCEDNLPRAREFLERLGFVPTDEMDGDKTVWKWTDE